MSKRDERCNWQDDNGKRCRRLAAQEIDYHGDRESYGDELSWVRIFLCAVHKLRGGTERWSK